MNPLKFIKIIIALSVCFTALLFGQASKADSFDIIREGKTYKCTLTEDSNCWESCRGNKNSFSYCRAYCKTSSPGCWNACRTDNNSFSYCRAYCETDQDDCWKACRTDKNSFSYCRSYCNTSTSGCWDACTSDNNSFSYCRSYCSSATPFEMLFSRAHSEN